MRLIFFLLRPIYYLLYHQFAWTYDFVAAVISLGRWQDWVQTALPYLNGRVLEIGFGPGHLQLSLNEIKLPAFGLDESRQMARQASRRLRKQGAIFRLSRGYAQHLPFADGGFDSVCATFPAEYIFDPQALKEIRRVLVPAGRLIILPMAWITGTRLLERLMAWLFRVSGEAPGKPGPVSAAIKDRFAHAGFEVRSEIVKRKGSQVLVIVAEKRPGS
ncbi:MAG: methyltransferase domain-containing protein [Candidatus Atribacteria bacterium]|nr:methyltransferase domain-containing protein [Candidatus Atribacteria bacterium]